MRGWRCCWFDHALTLWLRLCHASRFALRFRQFIDPHPLVAPEVLAQAEASFAAEEKEWELEQLEAIKDEEDARQAADMELVAMGSGSLREGVDAARALYVSRVLGRCLVPRLTCCALSGRASATCASLGACGARGS